MWAVLILPNRRLHLPGRFGSITHIVGGSVLTKMEKKFTLLHTVATAGIFSAVSFWYGFMFGRESSRKQLGDLIEDLRRGNDSVPPPPHT
ncbi:hypothetical protein V2J09_014838 [Rumex salicifolius]